MPSLETESREDASRGYLMGAGVLFGGETEEARDVFDLHEGTLEVADYVASVVGLFEDDLSEMWVRFSGHWSS